VFSAWSVSGSYKGTKWSFEAVKGERFICIEGKPKLIRVEAGSNTSTVTLLFVRGDERGKKSQI
jgi:hypothetical protein